MSIQKLKILFIIVLSAIVLRGSYKAQSSTIPVGEPICKVVYSEAPEIKKFAKSALQLCNQNYPKIKRKLAANQLQAPRQVQLIFKKVLDEDRPAETLGSTIYLNSQWFITHPNDQGAIIHEMAHVVQNYPKDHPFWLREGIADHIRYWLGYKTSWSYPHCGPGSEHYTSGYQCSAAFLQYVEKAYDKNIVFKINKAMTDNRYNDALFKTYTGRTLEQLWGECQKRDCAPVSN